MSIGIVEIGQSLVITWLPPPEINGCPFQFHVVVENDGAIAEIFTQNPFAILPYVFIVCVTANVYIHILVNGDIISTASATYSTGKWPGLSHALHCFHKIHFPSIKSPVHKCATVFIKTPSFHHTLLIFWLDINSIQNLYLFQDSNVIFATWDVPLDSARCDLEYNVEIGINDEILYQFTTNDTSITVRENLSGCSEVQVNVISVNIPTDQRGSPVGDSITIGKVLLRTERVPRNHLPDS